MDYGSRPFMSKILNCEVIVEWTLYENGLLDPVKWSDIPDYELDVLVNPIFHFTVVDESGKLITDKRISDEVHEILIDVYWENYVEEDT